MYEISCLKVDMLFTMFVSVFRRRYVRSLVVMKQGHAIEPPNATCLKHVLCAAWQVLRFDSMLGAFKGHTAADDARRFQQRLKLYVAIWCCVNKHPGHVW